MRNRYRFHADMLLWVALLLVGGMLAGLSLARYQGYNAGMFDLGNMAQAIWSVTQGHPLIFTNYFGQMSRLGHHVEVIYVLLALPYALWPDPQVLLGIQAGLFALGALPVYALTMRRTASMLAGWVLALAYLFYPVAQTAVLFDFHGDTLAMPLLLFLLDAVDRRAWRSVVLFTALALGCKFYVALPVAGIGVVLALWGAADQRRVGVVMTITALLYGALAFLVVRPLFTLQAETSASQDYVQFYFGQIAAVWTTLDDRLLHSFFVFGPALLLLGHGWRWLLPAAPVALAVLISTAPGPGYDYRFHHYALVVPFIIMAAIDSTTALQARARARRVQPASPLQRLLHWRMLLIITLMMVLLFNITLVDTPLNQQFWQAPVAQGLDPSAYGITPRDRLKDRVLATEVPPHVPLAASHFLAAHLTNREILYTVRYPFATGVEFLPSILPDVEYVLADALFDYRVPSGAGFAGGAAYEVREIAQVLREPAFELVAMRDGLLLFARDAPPAQVLEQGIPTVVTDTPRLHATPDTPIGLVDVQITPVDAERRRFQATFQWRANWEAQQEPPGRYVAVSRLEGVEHSRMVHLPTYALLPTTAWQPGDIVRETFEVELPPDIAPGRYTWSVAWYDLGNSEAYATDVRSLLPGSEPLLVGEVVVE